MIVFLCHCVQAEIQYCTVDKSECERIGTFRFCESVNWNQISSTWLQLISRNLKSSSSNLICHLIICFNRLNCLLVLAVKSFENWDLRVCACLYTCVFACENASMNLYFICWVTSLCVDGASFWDCNYGKWCIHESCPGTGKSVLLWLIKDWRRWRQVGKLPDNFF